MEINILEPADTAVPTMRALPWLSTLSPDWRQLMSADWRQFMSADRRQLMSAGSVAVTPAGGRVRAVSTPVVAAYRVTGLNGSTVCAGNTQVHAAARLMGASADHKFSTRVGPPSSPPV